MKIIFLDRKTLGNDVDLQQFENLGEVIYYDCTQPTDVLSRVKYADVVVTNKAIVDKHTMEHSNIKLICVTATGLNNIDLEYAKTKKIPVKNVAGYSTASVTQLAFSYILQFVQHINFYDKYVKSGGWENSDIFTNNDKPFYELDGKTVGIIGLGNIGKEVANIATAFGCNVIYYSTSGKNTDSIYKSVSLETLLQDSDIISIHCALNEKTNNLLNKNNLDSLKEGAILLNLGRGGLVNEQDITDALNNGKDIYFATDVATAEPIVKSSPLLRIDNKDRFIITPHIAWASIEARTRLMDLVYKNIQETL
jgi:glycerate dehydrogenase